MIFLNGKEDKKNWHLNGNSKQWVRNNSKVHIDTHTHTRVRVFIEVIIQNVARLISVILKI